MDELTMYLLSIDWDYVTGDCQEFHTRCCGFCKESDGFYPSNNKKRGEVESIRLDWNKKLKELKEIPVEFKTPIYVAECHASIMEVVNAHSGPYEVMDFDAHYDRYRDGILCCGNWIYHVERLNGIVMKTPKVKCVDAVFFCRSSPWTPQNMDGKFYELIYNYCSRAKVEPRFIGHMRKSLRKTYQKLYGRQIATI